MSSKKRGNKKRGRWNRGVRHLCTLVLGFQKNACRGCLFFVFCYGFSFIAWILNSSNLLSYGSELRKRYTLGLLLICLEKEVFWKFFAWEGALDLSGEMKGLPGWPGGFGSTSRLSNCIDQLRPRQFWKIFPTRQEHLPLTSSGILYGVPHKICIFLNMFAKIF